MKPRVIFFGTPEFVTPIISALGEKGWLAGVITAPDKKVGRKQILTPSPVKSFIGLSLKGLAFQAPEKLDSEVTKKLKKLKPDLFVVAAYGKIFPQEVLDIPKYGSLNIHPSLLPRYRGPSPIQNAILNGDKVSGVSIIKMDQKMDHGPIVITKKISLSDKDTCVTLSTKLFTEGAGLLIKIIPDFIAGRVKLTPQNDSQATSTHLIKKEDGYFDINNLLANRQVPQFYEKLDRIIRAYYPWPNAWTKWDGKIVKFYPGNVVQMEGKKPMLLADFLRGYPDFPLKTLF